MKTYLVYNKKTGIITHQFTGTKENLLLNVSNDEKYFEYTGQIKNKIVCNGEVTEIPNDDAKAIDKLKKYFKSLRNSALSASDWTHSLDSPLTPEKKAEWATYRQALRDLPQNYPDIASLDEVVWPEMPSSTT